MLVSSVWECGLRLEDLNEMPDIVGIHLALNSEAWSISMANYLNLKSVMTSQVPSLLNKHVYIHARLCIDLFCIPFDSEAESHYKCAQTTI